MEKYLIDQYDVIEDVDYLISVDDIEDFVRDIDDLFDCGQGYYNDKANVILKIGDKFYSVDVTAEIGSAKQDRGERLYWVESIKSVSYKEIEKPQPKVIEKYVTCYYANKKDKVFYTGDGWKTIDYGIQIVHESEPSVQYPSPDQIKANKPTDIDILYANVEKRFFF